MAMMCRFAKKEKTPMTNGAVALCPVQKRKDPLCGSHKLPHSIAATLLIVVSLRRLVATLVRRSSPMWKSRSKIRADAFASALPLRMQASHSKWYETQGSSNGWGRFCFCRGLAIAFANSRHFKHCHCKQKVGTGRQVFKICLPVKGDRMRHR